MNRSVHTLLQAGLSACLWVSLFHANDWLFASFAWTQTINWVFLPAAVRLLTVLFWGWRGALGLWAGTLLTNVPVFGFLTLQSCIVATLSATSPYMAVVLGRRLLSLPPTLQGITATSLLTLAAVSAACSVALHTVYFWTLGQTQVFQGLISMLVGDVLGTLVVLYTVRGLLTLTDFARSPPA